MCRASHLNRVLIGTYIYLQAPLAAENTLLQRDVLDQCQQDTDFAGRGFKKYPVGRALRIERGPADGNLYLASIGTKAKFSHKGVIFLEHARTPRR